MYWYRKLAGLIFQENQSRKQYESLVAQKEHCDKIAKVMPSPTLGPTDVHIRAIKRDVKRPLSDLLFLLWFQSFEAGMQQGHHSSSSSNHSFSQIASGRPHDSARRSHHRHRPTLSPSASKKHPSTSPHIGGAVH